MSLRNQLRKATARWAYTYLTWASSRRNFDGGAMSRWFRFYDSVLDDPKVQRLADHLFKGWVNILCLCSISNGVIPPLRDVAFALRITDDHADSLIQSLFEAGLLDDDGGLLKPHNWDQRQYIDKTNKERQQRFRDKNKSQDLASKVVTQNNAVTNGAVTSPRTDTDTDNKKHTKINRTSISRSASLAEFNSFWEVYPKRSGKGAAEKAWGKASTVADGSAIISAVRNYKFSEDLQFVPLPSTWLNQRRWEDEQPAEAPKPVRKERDLRNIPDSLLSNDDYWKKRTQQREWK